MTDNKEYGPSKDFSWIVIGVDAYGAISYLAASQGFHDCDMLGSWNLTDLLPDDTPYHTSCILKIKPSIDPEDCYISYNDSEAEILYQYK